jgi:2-dehydro-3-deoxygluconokinase
MPHILLKKNSMTRVVAIGECMVEMANTGGKTFAMGFAGDTFNTAWYLRRILPAHVTVSYASAVGSDVISQRMLDFMGAEGVDTTHVQRLAGRTVGLYLIQLNDGERSFAYWRSTSAARGLADDPVRLQDALAGADLAYLSGITLAILNDDARESLFTALARARTAGTIIAFDPNIRPALWSNAATMRQIITRMAAVADIVLPSFDDEATHFGDSTPVDTAQRYSAGGAALVVVKDGPNPIVTWHDGEIERHPIPSRVTQVVDSTAAGDSFNAGFLAQKLAGASLGDAVLMGAALAVRVIAGSGALVRGAVA